MADGMDCSVPLAPDRGTSLLDLPDEVLRQCGMCTLYLAPFRTVRNHCMGVCRRLLAVVLLDTRLPLNLRLGQPQESRSSRASLLCLARAFQQVRSLKVTIHEEPVLKQLEALFAPPLDVKTPCTDWLVNIAHVGLYSGQQEALCLPHLVPDSIAAACPNLQILKLGALRLGARNQPHDVQQQNQLPAVLALPQLQQLEFSSCHFYLPPDAFQEQLRRFTSLQTLCIYRGSYQGGDRSAYYAAIASSVSGHLAQLTMTHDNMLLLAHSQVAALLSCPYPVLHNMHLPDAVVDDLIMELLCVRLPSLSDLCVNAFKLKKDFTGSACNWHSLRMMHCDVASLPLLQAWMWTSLTMFLSYGWPTQVRV